MVIILCFCVHIRFWVIDEMDNQGAYGYKGARGAYPVPLITLPELGCDKGTG